MKQGIMWQVKRKEEGVKVCEARHYVASKEKGEGSEGCEARHYVASKEERGGSEGL